MNARFNTSALCLVLSAAVLGQQPNSGFSTMTLNGANGAPFPILLGARTSLPLTFGFSGAANQPYVVFQAAALSVGAAHLPASNSQNSVDLVLDPFPAKVIDGEAYPSVFSTDFSGNGGFTLTMPPAGNPPNGLPIGFQRALQGLLRDPLSSLGLTLTAATEVTVTQGPTIMALSLGSESNYTLTVPASMPIPFYGNDYTTLYVNVNGFIAFGTPVFNDFTPTPSEFTSGPPRIAAFWTDLDQSYSGTVTATVETPQGGNPGYIRIDVIDIDGWAVAAHHSFSMLARTDGYIEIAFPSTQNASLYDEITGIVAGNVGGAQAQKNFTGPEPLGSSVGSGILSTPPDFSKIGAVNESFFEWFGVTALGVMPNYGNPYDNTFDLFAKTLHFQPAGAGALPGSTNAYALY